MIALIGWGFLVNLEAGASMRVKCLIYWGLLLTQSHLTRQTVMKRKLLRNREFVLVIYSKRQYNVRFAVYGPFELSFAERVYRAHSDF